VSFCEVAWLVRKRRVALTPTVRDWRLQLLDQGIEETAIDGSIAIAAMELESLHGDPADRLIAATALALDAVLLTADERLLGSQGPLRTADARL
jgi:PIN domain nuclease of toxin-antitoxin system